MINVLTNVEAAAALVELHAECEVRLRHFGKELSPKYAQAVALACMALKNEDEDRK